ncbi:MAG: DUF3536 domain-containing protein [Gemmatimonadota bacterium]|nr:DUF3536 domain-containing protein [Gemmatimonadota bacterium]
MNSPRSAIIHAHFYQPPREDPWLDEVPREPSAAPHHDWNERIERECYRAVVAARVATQDGRIAKVVNTLHAASFNVGPTLLRWLAPAAPATYAAILEADRESCSRRDGHGNALAMPYHHPILPLASRRDKHTEVQWGIADFRHRFGRRPEGMWLPETAVDAETLDVLADAGIRFTVLAPHQVRAAPPGGLPGLYRTPSGRTIAVFVYDGSISHDVAFGALLRDAREWEHRMVDGTDRGLVAMATDGETYGHHHKFGEMALAAVLEKLAHRSDVQVENFASFLARHPPRHEVDLVAPTSWSCVHGVERWRTECGCRMHPDRPTQQRWRSALRESLDWLAGEVHAAFVREGTPLFGDPWAARDEFGQAIAAGSEACAAFAADRVRSTDPENRIRAAELLDMERNALGMFTSCGWFVDDIGGIETRQVLRYAARAIDLAGDERIRLEDGLRQRLAAAKSNDAAVGSGRDVYDAGRPAVPAEARVAAGGGARLALGLTLPLAVGPFDLRRAADGHHDTTVQVTDRRTGRSRTWRIDTTRPSTGRLHQRLSSTDLDVTHTATVSDLPFAIQREVRPVLYADIVRLRYVDAERQALLSGAEPVEVARGALLRLVESLAAGTDDCEPVHDVLDLFDLLERHYPFDAQTRLYRVWEHAEGPRQRILGSIAHRMGFA